MVDDFDFMPIVSSEEVDEKIPEKPGVYIGFNKTGGDELRITYIGESANLKKRLRRHERPCTHYSYEVIERGDISEGNAESVRKTRESELIERFAPELNRKQVDNSRTMSEEWVVRFSDGALELWKRPDSLLREGGPSWFPEERIRVLNSSYAGHIGLENKSDAKGEKDGEKAVELND